MIAFYLIEGLRGRTKGGLVLEKDPPDRWIFQLHDFQKVKSYYFSMGYKVC